MQTTATMDSRIVWLVAVAATLMVLIGAVLGPRPAFALLCHQMPARSFIVDGHLFAVCHRCTGLYLGIFVGSMIGAIPVLRSAVNVWALKLMAIAAVLLIVDVGLDAVRILNNTAATRAATGFGLGLSAGLFLTTLIPNILPEKE